MQETAFADGLRGMAALYVVSSHFVLCYARHLVNPCCAPGTETPTMMQRPILRLVAAGHSWVAMFFILLGFVNALKPLSLMRAGRADAACSKLASSAFGRVLRLLLPATVATIISWLICQFGLYELARNSDAFWLKESTPGPSPNMFAALLDLKTGLIETWKPEGNNPYDQPQWALVYLLLGSFMTILGLLVTVNMTTIWRSVALCILVWCSIHWSHKTGDPYVGLACYGGILLAELSLSPLPQRLSRASPYISLPVATFALVLMSYPGSNPAGAPWSASLESFGRSHFGDSATDRIYGTIGGMLLLASIIISPHARYCLSCKPFKWLGKVSFAVYLLHGTMLRTLFAWLLFHGSEKVEIQEVVNQDPLWPSGVVVMYMRYPLPGASRCAVATIITLVATLSASHLWTTRVEPVCATLTDLLEKLVRGTLSTEEAIDTVVKPATEKGLLLPLRQD